MSKKSDILNWYNLIQTSFSSKPGIANGPASRGGGVNLVGQRITLHRNKFHFCIIQIILNKINIKFFEKSLDLANFLNFTDLPQGVGVPPPPPIGEPWFET